MTSIWTWGGVFWHTPFTSVGMTGCAGIGKTWTSWYSRAIRVFVSLVSQGWKRKWLKLHRSDNSTIEQERIQEWRLEFCPWFSRFQETMDVFGVISSQLNSEPFVYLGFPHKELTHAITTSNTNFKATAFKSRSCTYKNPTFVGRWFQIKPIWTHRHT